MTHDKRPVIVVLYPARDITGPLINSGHMARALKGRARIVLILPQNSRVPQSFLHDFWQVHHLPLVFLSKRRRDILRYFPALWQSSGKLRALMRALDAQALFLCDFYLAHGAILRLLGLRVPIFTWVRCHPQRMMGRVARAFLWLAARSSNRMIAVSDYILQLLPPHYRAIRLYDFFAEVPPMRSASLTMERIEIVFIGNYIPGKGQDVALQGFASAAAQDARLHLSFYGSEMNLEKNRRYKASLKQQAQRLGISERVSFNGMVDDVTAILQHAYVAINCSQSESFSMTVLEASGCGVPVIATDSGGPREIIDDGVTGFLIPVDDAVQLSERIVQLAANPALAQQMGKAGAKRVQRVFSEHAFIRQLSTILAEQGVQI